MTSELIDVEWAYMGARMSGDKLAHLWRPEDNLDQVLYFSVGARLVGAVYEVKCTPDRSRAQIKNAKYVRALDDKVLIAEWVAANSAAMAALEAERAIKRIKRNQSQEIGQLTLSEIRDLMGRSPTLIQQGYVTAVLQYLNYGRR